MNRCIAININNKKCRAKTNNLFCCEKHKPFNKEIIENGCFMCMEKIILSKDLILFKCNHAFHKSCYIEWLRYSTYDSPICMICRSNVMTNKEKNNKIKEISNSHNLEIYNILYKW